jgi:hypothetical protein
MAADLAKRLAHADRVNSRLHKRARHDRDIAAAIEVTDLARGFLHAGLASAVSDHRQTLAHSHAAAQLLGSERLDYCEVPGQTGMPGATEPKPPSTVAPGTNKAIGFASRRSIAVAYCPAAGQR